LHPQSSVLSPQSSVLSPQSSVLSPQTTPMNQPKLPTYVHFSQLILGIVGLLFILYIAQDILIPIVFSLLLAILLNPLVEFQQRFGINRVVAILLSITVAVVISFSVLYFIASQFSMFTEALPVLSQRFKELFENAALFFQKKLHMNRLQASQWVENLKGNSLNTVIPMINSTINTLAGVLVVIVLLPVYIFMFLFYKPLLHEFIQKLFSNSQIGQVEEVLDEAKTLIQSYLTGLLIEGVLVAILNTISLMIVGLDYALLLGVIGAILNVIPYIGGIIGIGLPMLLAVATLGWSSAFLILLLYGVVQFIDNNIIMPRVVASKVKINGLFSIIVVFIGGALWGVSGMFLSIPVTAILKVIFDRVPILEPFGYVLGDNMPPLLVRKKKKL
jgi:predicted PurR-regulated permease PerM